MNDILEVHVLPEYCDENCKYVEHNHIEICPCCGGKYMSTDAYSMLNIGDVLTCKCGAQFEILTPPGYDSCKVKLIYGELLKKV